RELLWTLLPLAVLLGWCLFVSRRRRLLEVTGVLIVCLVSFETARALRISAPLISVARPDSLLPLLEVEHGRPTAPSLSLDRQPTDGQNNRNLLTGIAEFPSYEPMTSEILTLWRDDEWMSSWLLGEDRIWFARSASARPSRTRLFGKFRRRATKQGRPLLWLHDVDEGLNADPTFPASKIGEGSRRLRQLPVELIDYRHDRLAFSVDAPRDGWLWITDRWAPGWRAQVDGTDVRVYRAGFLFRAVPIPRGPHVVTMRYRPFGHPWLWILSWSTMAAILAATEWRCRSRSLPQPTAAEIDHTFGDPQPGDAQRIDTTPNASPTPDGATEPETQDARPTG
ncbi:MAG: YfhO family protein, partial [Acidobacteriota bacterium]